jgi:hypothetical protein
MYLLLRRIFSHQGDEEDVFPGRQVEEWLVETRHEARLYSQSRFELIVEAAGLRHSSWIQNRFKNG